jgi:hypothetical protein
MSFNYDMLSFSPKKEIGEVKKRTESPEKGKDGL